MFVNLHISKVVMIKYILIISGGSAGCILRYLISSWMNTQTTASLPYGTLCVNLIGSLLIGFLFGWLIYEGTMNENLQLLLFTGFLGGFTTFSAFALENM